MITRINRYSRLVLAAAGIWMLSGCGVDQSPTASAPGATQPSSGKTYLSFAAGPGQQGLAKITSTADAPTLIATETITPSGGSVRVVDRGDGGNLDDLRALLAVPAGALNQDTAITMTLQGETLADIAIGFEPSGLVFNTPATLQLKVGNGVVDLPLDTMVALVTEADGTTAQVPILELRQIEGATWIVIQVPGFSVYSLGGGNP